MVVGFITTYAIRRGVFDTTLCYKGCQLLAAGQRFSPGTPVSSINKTEILLKVALKTITITQTQHPPNSRFAVLQY